jgi:hypothetical protein
MGVGVLAGGSIAVIERIPFDAAYSTLSGKDCCIVRLDQGKSDCRRSAGPLRKPLLG